MYNNLEELMNNKIFKYFKEISSIPRGSGNEKGISDYIFNFAKQRNLNVIQDKYLNIIIKKEATKGYESAPTVILQGHMDMVCEKHPYIQHDFEKDPIEFEIKEDMLYAKGTTLGADDGLAIAYVLALLDDDTIEHPSLEVVLTTEEESSMFGALNIDEKLLEGKILINLDSEEEGKLLVGSAGGIDTIQRIPIAWEGSKAELVAFNINVGGLQGGHSGLEIHKRRGNANKILGRILYDLIDDIDYNLCFIEGGKKTSAIPINSKGTILIEKDLEEKLNKKIKLWDSNLKQELDLKEPNVYVELERLNVTLDRAFSKDTTMKVITSLNLTADGIQTTSAHMEGLVESSSNLGIVTTKDYEVVLESGIRSSIDSLKDNMVNNIKCLSRITDSNLDFYSEYPRWNYNKDSKILCLCKNVFEKLYNKTPEITAYHCGLECGVFIEKIPSLDCISIGPDIFRVHTPSEHLSISSTERTWKYFLEILKEIKYL
ncbi:aminoacyl-histidine dipeptidase [Clostridium niameyense]|uniref:Cytosol non-specific dipeptidase n=1 Tax=Clostridium niameyense TaxID=1622073 RepID=A0A6M0R8K7_9CLOT|nr:aminoacyl-histidine dipeptidase [Clostridium niameyense]NEZ46574.1 aminoacyl-histidine dipeptidase [Clostridium niameyense]